MDYKETFGGKIIILAGDFRQLPTVIKRASCGQIVINYFQKLYLWKHFKTMKLKENMRIQNCRNDAKLLEFDEWIEKLGNVKLYSIASADFTLPCLNIFAQK